MAQPQLLHVQPIKLGRIGVTKVVDTLEHFSPRVLLDRTYEDFTPHHDWLRPQYLDEKYRMVLSIHTFVLKTKHHTVLIDTCVGNDKISGFPQWNKRNAPFLTDLKAADVPLESVDYVFCTHMHVDHVGWNTRRQDGRWVPTFPNAKYLFNKVEWAHWEQAQDPLDVAVMDESIRPIIEAGQAEFVDVKDFGIGDEIVLEPTPGHTPGHCSVHLKSAGREAVITGDMMIHPVQVAEPHWNQLADADKSQAVRTRSGFVERYCDTDVLILGSHFNDPTGVHIVSHGEGKRVKV